MTTVSAPYFDRRGGRVVERQSMTPWTVRVRTGNEIRFYRFPEKSDAQKFYESHALVESVSFRDNLGKRRHWKHARVAQTRDGKSLLVTRVKPNGDALLSSKSPTSYTIVPEALVHNPRNPR